MPNPSDAIIKALRGQTSGAALSPVPNPLVNALYLSASDPSNVAMGYGKRYDSNTQKGQGFFGELPNTGSGGFSTELSAADGMGVAPFDYPLINPQMTKSQLDNLLAGGAPDAATYDAARKSALLQVGMGASPFASAGAQLFSPNDLQK